MGGFLERCPEPNHKVWVEFKHRKVCEGSPLCKWNRKRGGQSGKEGAGVGAEQAVSAGHRSALENLEGAWSQS